MQQLDVGGRTITVYVHDTDNKVQTTRPSATGPHHDAYPLYDVSAHEFSAFLSVLYPKYADIFLVVASPPCSLPLDNL